MALKNGNCIIGQNIGCDKIYKKRMTWPESILDFIVFLLVSVGIIIKSFYHAIFGKHEKSLHGEIALITGGGGGLGRLLAERLASQGAIIVLWDINKEAMEETAKQISQDFPLTGQIQKAVHNGTNGHAGQNGFAVQNGHNGQNGTNGHVTQHQMRCRGYVVDISDRNDVYRAAELVRRDVGDVTMLFNNAGVVSGRSLLDTPDHLIERTFNVNVIAHFWTTKAFLPAMIRSNHGHVVTVASLAGHVGISKLVDYCSSKFAAVGFDEALRMELEGRGLDGVKTTVICPYFIRSTGMFDDVNSRFVPKLDGVDVANRIIHAVRTNEYFLIMPGYFRILMVLRWIFPWACSAGFLRRLVVDAAPTQPGAFTNNNTDKSKA